MKERRTSNVELPTSNERKRSRGTLILLAILLLAAGLRFHSITRHALWGDEIYTLESSAGHGLGSKRLNNAGFLPAVPDLIGLDAARPWWSVATALARDDNHPPLYFLILRAWRQVLGDSDAAMRSLSVLFSLAAIALLYDATKQLHGETAARWTALLMAVAQPQIQFAQEARAYTLLLLLACGACAAVARLERLGLSKRRIIALAGCALAMLLTHYYGIVAIAVIGLYALLRFRGRNRTAAICALAAAGALFLALWGWGLWIQRDNVGANNWYIVEPAAGHLAATLRRVIQLPMQLLCEPMRRAELAASFAAILYVIPFFMLRRRPDLLLWALWLDVTVGFVVAIDVAQSSRQLVFLRYTILASPAVYALIGALLSDSKRRWMAHALPAAAVLACVLELPATYEWTLTPKPDWRIPAAMIDRDARADDVLLFYGDYPRDPGIVPNNYFCLRHYAKRLPAAAAFLTGPPDEALLQRLRQAHAVWIVAPREMPVPPDALRGFVATERCFEYGLPVMERWEPVAAPSRDLAR